MFDDPKKKKYRDEPEPSTKDEKGGQATYEQDSEMEDTGDVSDMGDTETTIEDED